MFVVRAAASALMFASLFGAALADSSQINTLPVDEAIAIALSEQPGSVVEAEIDEFNGRPVFDIEILGAAGQEIEFKIDAQTGEILSKWIDDDPTDDPGTLDADNAFGELEVVAASPDFAMNGVALTPDGRVFVSIPQWTETSSPSVAEVYPDGSIRPFPGNEWNEFDRVQARDRFVNVNSVHADGTGSLWVVDYAGPNFEPSIEGAQKLVKIDLATNKVARVYRFGDDILPEGARLNDVRVDANKGVAYVSEFGIGAIIVVDLKFGASFRALDRHYSTRAHPDVSTTFLGKPFRTDFLQVNDVELSPDGGTLSFQPTGGPIMWQVPTALLQEPTDNTQLEPYVAVAGKSMTIGGMTRDEAGLLYLGSVQDNAVWVLDPEIGETRKLLQDNRLLWPDAMSISSDGYLYIPAPQLRLLPEFNDGIDHTIGDFTVYRAKLPDAD